MKKSVLVVLSLGLCSLISASVSACPGCSAAVGSGAATSKEAMLGVALSYSIIFMLSVVLSLIGFLGYKIASVIRAENKRHRTPSLQTIQAARQGAPGADLSQGVVA